MRRRIAGLAVVGVLWASAAMAEPVMKAHFSLSRQNLARRALNVPAGAPFRMTGVPLEARTVTLALERFEVFTEDARILVQERKGSRLATPPRRAWFRGTIAGEPESLVFLAVGEDSVHGLIHSRERLHVLGTEPGAPSLDEALVVRAFDQSAAKQRSQPWKCALDQLPAGVLGGDQAFPSIFDGALDLVTAPASAQYSVKVAIETDYELYALFGSVDATAAYIGDLFGAISTIYHRELGTTLRLNFVSLWTGGAGSDPWTATDSYDALIQVRDWWGLNRSQALYPRAITHFLSPKYLGGGIAYLGVLCNATYGYGVTGHIDGSFTPASPNSVWDITAVAHEIGHNFNSDHSHCYIPEVDRCYGGESGCYSGAESLPAGGQGSLMSYCHLLGGESALALSLGTAGLYGTQSERVPQLMRNYVAGRPLSCRGVVDAPPADFNGDGRSDLIIYRNGAWLELTPWPQR